MQKNSQMRRYIGCDVQRSPKHKRSVLRELGCTTLFIANQLINSLFKKFYSLALAGVAQWTEHWPASQRVTSLIPRSGHMPGLQARSPVRGA